MTTRYDRAYECTRCGHFTVVTKIGRVHEECPKGCGGSLIMAAIQYHNSGILLIAGEQVVDTGRGEFELVGSYRDGV
jgi:hypothetical protein